MFIGTPAVEAAISGGASGVGLDITQLSPLFLHFLAWQRLNQVCCSCRSLQKKQSKHLFKHTFYFQTVLGPNRSTSRCK